MGYFTCCFPAFPRLIRLHKRKKVNCQTTDVAAFVKARENERFSAVADSVNTSNIEVEDFMFISESSIF